MRKTAHRFEPQGCIGIRLRDLFQLRDGPAVPADPQRADSGLLEFHVIVDMRGVVDVEQRIDPSIATGVGQGADCRLLQLGITAGDRDLPEFGDGAIRGRGSDADTRDHRPLEPRILQGVVECDQGLHRLLASD